MTEDYRKKGTLLIGHLIKCSPCKCNVSRIPFRTGIKIFHQELDLKAHCLYLFLAGCLFASCRIISGLKEIAESHLGIHSCLTEACMFLVYRVKILLGEFVCGDLFSAWSLRGRLGIVFYLLACFYSCCRSRF